MLHTILPALQRRPEVHSGIPRGRISRNAQPRIEIALLTGGFDRPYAFGLATALSASNVHLDVIGGAEIDSPELHTIPRLNFLNLYWDPREHSGVVGRIWRVLFFYLKLLRYTLTARPRIFHILWHNKAELFDRTLLMLYYKALGKKITFTAHNVNAGKRDATDSVVNRLSLKIQYRLADHIFVHTDQMRAELEDEFDIRREAITVIPFGINNAVPNTTMTPREARRRLGIKRREKCILFFGSVRPYKGIEYLVGAFRRIARDNEYRLIIAGEPKKGTGTYLHRILEAINETSIRERIIQKLEYVPDEDTELYFKAADVLALPYTEVSQSGVMFLAYSFGLPVIGTDVGAFREDIVVGKTGFLCPARDPDALAKAIERYFESPLFKTLDIRRREIRDYATARNSWNIVAERTCKAYERLLQGRPS